MAAPTDSPPLDRLRELEAENERLRAGLRPRRRGRSALSAVALTLAVLLAPVAVLSTWVRAELVDTDRFVATLAPLTDDPAVQEFIADQVMSAVDAQLDFDEVVASVTAGLAELDLPPQASAALGLLRGPAAHGMRSAVSSAVSETVASDAFSGAWQLALTQTHRAGIALMQGRADSVLTVEDGMLALQLGSVVGAVSTELQDRGFALASLIPEVTASIELAPAESLLLARGGYATAVAAGIWLPWATLGLLVCGVALARFRVRAVTRAAVALFAVFGLLLVGLRVGSAAFEGMVSPATMSAEAANAITAQLTATLASTLTALAFAAALIGVGTFLAGPSRVAVGLRGLLTAGFARARAGLARHGLGTGALGPILERFRSAIALGLATLGVLIVFVSRPVSVPTVAWTTVGVLAGLALLELLRRPAESGAAPDAAPAGGPDPAPDAGPAGGPDPAPDAANSGRRSELAQD
ncbi:hypothetical protein [Leucobacter luti]|uniref:Integral membrane protein n=1 Tax=Leucobacter luti TaxID=340320 RepID=A0A4Q7TPI3_9MICO|nr:hypothetical protein [Leucobacter luti]MBL3699979.1 hypothetical protein [Leucobacter luti]RZT62705.1 hypothetical protein EV139_2405 [Leucobacter luti]